MVRLRDLQERVVQLVNDACCFAVMMSSGVDDVRSVLDSYNESGGDLLEKFKERRHAYMVSSHQHSLPAW